MSSLTSQLDQMVKNNQGVQIPNLWFDQVDTSLQIYHKCLTFDFVAILLNETLDEPSQTNVSKFHFEIFYQTQLIFIASFIMGQRRGEPSNSGGFILPLPAAPPVNAIHLELSQRSENKVFDSTSAKMPFRVRKSASFLLYR
jgi:hypothetical protein